MLNHYGAWGWRRSAKARALLATLRVFEMLCMHFRVEAQDEVLGMYPGTGSTYWTTVTVWQYGSMAVYTVWQYGVLTVLC